jgi:hypothetical protein
VVPEPQKFRKHTVGEAPPLWVWQLVIGFGQSAVAVHGCRQMLTCAPENW